MDQMLRTASLYRNLHLKVKFASLLPSVVNQCSGHMGKYTDKTSSCFQKTESITEMLTLPVKNWKSLHETGLDVSSLKNFYSSQKCESVLFRCNHILSGPKDIFNNSRILFSNGARHFSTSRVSFISGSAEASTLPEPASTVLGSPASSDLLYPDFALISGAEKVITHIHHLTGLPWWSSIILTAFMLRVVLMVPLTAYTFHNMARLQRIQPEVKQTAERLKQEVAMAMRQYGWDKYKAKKEFDKNFKRLMTELYIRENCHPMKNVAAFWVQTPVWLSVSYALRNVATRAANPGMDHHEDCSGLAEGGLPWCSDLTTGDSTWVLPVMMGAVTLFNVEIGHLNVPEVTKYRKRLTIALRSLSLIFIPITASVPSAMALYWVSSGTFAALQNLLFEYSPFRRLIGLPQSPNESKHPLKSVALKAKARYFSR